VMDGSLRHCHPGKGRGGGCQGRRWRQTQVNLAGLCKGIGRLFSGHRLHTGAVHTSSNQRGRRMADTGRSGSEHSTLLKSRPAAR
jgi:hypothetical protein